MQKTLSSISKPEKRTDPGASLRIGPVGEQEDRARSATRMTMVRRTWRTRKANRKVWDISGGQGLSWRGLPGTDSPRDPSKLFTKFPLVLMIVHRHLLLGVTNVAWLAMISLLTILSQHRSTAQFEWIPAASIRILCLCFAGSKLTRWWRRLLRELGVVTTDSLAGERRIVEWRAR